MITTNCDFYIWTRVIIWILILISLYGKLNYDLFSGEITNFIFNTVLTTLITDFLIFLSIVIAVDCKGSNDNEGLAILAGF